MEHDFNSGDISNDDTSDFDEHHEHEPKSKYHYLKLVAFNFKWYK